MVNFKKMDDKDFVFMNKPIASSEEKAFSDFLKTRKALKSRMVKRREKIRKIKTS